MAALRSHHRPVRKIHQHFVRTLDSKVFINAASVESRPDVPGHSAYTILHDQKDHWLVQQMLVAYDTDEEVRLRSERQVPPL